jgi:hypothetical protein
MANGELPRKGQQMTANTFQEGQLYEVLVGDNSKDSEEQLKADCEVYSTVKEILSVQRPNHPNRESFNHESRIMPSPNQQSTQSSRPHSAAS